MCEPPAVGAAEDLQRLELLVGRVVSVDEHPGARAPSWLLTIDLGSRGRREGSVSSANYGVGELDGRDILCALDGDGVIILAAQSHARGGVLLLPDGPVDPGTAVS